MNNYEMLINELIQLPSETSWVEFKHNNCKPETIGENIIALSNSATLDDRNEAYIVWGIDDNSHEIIGTKFNNITEKIGNQELQNWLITQLSDNANFKFLSFDMNNIPIVLLIIYKATFGPVSFKKVDYIRVGSYTKKLMDHKSIQLKLFNKFSSTKFEDIIALSNINATDIIEKINFEIYFEIKGIPIPTTIQEKIHYMIQEKVIVKEENSKYSITNLGAILFAKKLSDFNNLERKAIRLIQYDGDNKLNILKNYTENQGYAISFSKTLLVLTTLLPSQEIIISHTRETKFEYPPIVIREIIANALIHQDFSITGAGPTIEIFGNRIEITNPGCPLVKINRIVDNPPRSRNEKLASLMRNLKMCEELGSGWDRIVLSCEQAEQSIPKIELYDEDTKVTFCKKQPFQSMSAENKLWDCYMHACIKYVSKENLTNSSLRTRFGVDSKNSAPISRLIKKAIEQNLIKHVDPTTAPKHMCYIPFWA